MRSSILLLFFAFFCQLSLNTTILVTATNILKLGDQLNSTWNLVSDGRKFSLGFFTMENTNLSYLGIWYNNDDSSRKVWIANSDSPLLNNSGALEIDILSGSLLISLHGNTVKNISGYVGPSNTTVAKLEDSGNFIILDDESNGKILWQSFDHPTNTLLPRMKLGFNTTTRTNWTLTSWLSDDIPAPGALTMSLEGIDDSGQLVIRRRGELYWTSGPMETIPRRAEFHWHSGPNDTNQSFPYASELTSGSTLYRRNLNLVIDNGGMYFYYETDGPKPTLELSIEGWIDDLENSQSIGYYNIFCYGYQSNDGCVTSTLPTCRNRGDLFKSKVAYFLPSSASINFDNDSSLSLSDCMERCWKDCTCLGFSTSNNGVGCLTWNGNGNYIIDESGKAVSKYVLVREETSRGRSWIWIAVLVPIFVIASLITFTILRRQRLKAKEKKQREELLRQFDTADSISDAQEIEHSGGEHGHDVKMFGFGSIMVATINFSSDNKLGQGGFGPVYKGKLLNGREVAVKRLSRTSGQGIIEFKNELILISKLQHTNLVRVLGCCIHQEEKMLVYEYMPNKSLDFFLFDQEKKEMLDWSARFTIIEGVAQGLLYLHKYSRMKVIHRDLKASNVLLDENMNPKIADFGMATILNPEEAQANTNWVVGTYGYMAPEYAMEGTFSIKSDVFSFGVLVLEIISGRRNNSFYNIEHPLNLVGFAWELWRAAYALELKDKSLGDEFPTNQILRAIQVGLLCVQENAEDRPTMQEVVSMFGNESMVLPSPFSKETCLFYRKK